MESKNKYSIWIKIVSVAIPVVVAILFGVRVDYELPIFLPPIYSSLNAITAVLLVLALIAIKSKKIKLHQRLMQTCIALSLAFLLMYIAYHMTSNSTIFGDINRDGMKTSPNFDETVKIAELSNCPVVISGGVSSMNDIKKAKELNNKKIEGIIVGKAIYDGDIKLDELVKEISA